MKPTPSDIDATLNALRRLTIAQLREKYLEVFSEPTRSGNKDYLFKKLAWRIQSLTEGTLSERARNRAQELARDADLRTTLPRPPKAKEGATVRTVALPARSATTHDRLPVAGTVLSRKYRGRQIEAKVLVQGFEYEGQVYRSLSAVAKAVRPAACAAARHAQANVAIRIDASREQPVAQEVMMHRAIEHVREQGLLVGAAIWSVAPDRRRYRPRRRSIAGRE